MDSIVKIFDDNSDLYVEKYMDVSRYGESLDYLVNHIPTNTNVLDVGCGPGNVIRYLLERNKNLKFLACDLSWNMLMLAKKHNPEVKIRCIDVRNIIQVDGEFSCVIASFILPYLNRSEVETFIADAAKLLNDSKGLLYLSYMGCEQDFSELKKPSSGKGKGILTQFYSKSSIENITKQFGFQLVYSSKVNIEGAENEPFYDVVLVVKKIKD